jgi:channel protein (hemolysin III family)
MFVDIAVADLNAPMTTTIELILFLGMGLGIVLVWPIFWHDLSTSAVVLCILGGLGYIGGIPFFLLGEKNPGYHVVRGFFNFYAMIHS